jgi:NTP pyrophosphatase (non-canonical NTP hydrolase)
MEVRVSKVTTDFDALLAEANAAFKSLTPEQQRVYLERQCESWVTAELALDRIKRSRAHHELRAANLARHAEYPGADRITPSFRGNELAGEVGEACNVIKKLERARLGIAGARPKLQDLADELADVVICADLIAMDFGIDLLGRAVPAKFNASSEKLGLQTRMAIARD